MTHAWPQGDAPDSFLTRSCAFLGNVGAALWYQKYRLWPLLLVVPLLWRWIARRSSLCRSLTTHGRKIVTYVLAVVGVQGPQTTHTLPQGDAPASFLTRTCALLGNVGAALWHGTCRLCSLSLEIPLLLWRCIARSCCFLTTRCLTPTCALLGNVGAALWHGTCRFWSLLLEVVLLLRRWIGNVGAALWHGTCRFWSLLLEVVLLLRRWIVTNCQSTVTYAHATAGVQEPSWLCQTPDALPQGDAPASGCQSIVASALAIIRGVQKPSWPVQRQDHHHPDSKCPTRGITNIGNSCYFASGLQLMCRTYGDRLIELATSNPSCELLQDISELVGHVRGGASVSSGGKVDLILSAVCDLNGGARTRFGGGRQADSSSAMTHLLSLIEVAQMGRNGDHYFDPVVTDDVSAEEHWTRYCNVHTTEFAQAQCGQTSEDVLCLCCGARGREPTVFRGFSALTINASAHELRNVQHAVDQWANSACKDEHGTCSNCKAVGQWRKARCISRFPSTGVLLVTVNREYHDNTGIARKHVGGVDLPKEVKFPGGNEREGTFRVKPVAACIHSGTVTGGHYYCVIADARGEAEGCVIANDDHISSSAKDISALAGQGSLFAFERVPPVLRVDTTGLKKIIE